jgi:hypothetical protein
MRPYLGATLIVVHPDLALALPHIQKLGPVDRAGLVDSELFELLLLGAK